MLQRLLDEAMAKATVYAQAYNAGGKKKSELQALKKAAMGAMDTYNKTLEKSTYRRWNAEGDPVKTAIRSLTMPGKRFQFKTDDDNHMNVVIKDADIRVNLPMMQAVLGKDIFADAKWFNKAEKLAYLVAGRLNEHISNSVMFSYGIADASKEFDFPDYIDPMSDDGIVYALQVVFDSILYIDNPDEPFTNLIHTTLKQDSDGRYYAKEWTVIRERMTKDGGTNTVAICNTGRFTDLVVEAMHGIMNDGDFSLVADASEQFPESEESNDEDSDE